MVQQIMVQRGQVLAGLASHLALAENDGVITQVQWALDFWHVLKDASPGQASFLGTLAGSSIGLFALLIGAWCNACLNRKRDNRLRREDQRAMAVALKTELAGWSELLGRFVESSKSEGPLSSSTRSGFPLPTTRLLPHMVAKLGLLRPTTIDQVITAYDAVEHLAWALVWKGAEIDRSTDFHTRWIMVPSEELPSAVEEIEATVTVLKSAIAELDRYEQPLVRLLVRNRKFFWA